MSKEIIRMKSEALKLLSVTSTDLSLDGASISLTVSGLGDKDSPRNCSQDSIESMEYLATELNGLLLERGFRITKSS